MYNPSDQHMGDWMQPGNFFGTPVDYEAKDMNPWRKSILQILLGIALYTVSIEYLQLELFMPLVGVILMLLGLRTLREENRWFFIGNLLVYVEGLWVLADVFFTGSALNGAFHRSAVWEIVWWVTRLTQMGVLLCLRQGLVAVFDKSGRLPRVKWVTALMALNAAAAVLQRPGLTAGYLLIGVYAGVFWALYRLGRALDDVGYEILSTPAALSDTVLTFLLVGLSAATILSGSLFLGKYPMKWTVWTETGSESIRQELTEIPDVDLVLGDLSEAELLACEGGSVAFWEKEVHTLDYSKECTMFVTHVYISLPGGEDRWKVIHHFRWVTQQTVSVPHAGTESLVVRLGDMARYAGNYTGRILYDRGSITMAAEPAEISLVPYSYFVTYDEKMPTTGLFTNFSIPKTVSNLRGYVSYELKFGEMPDFSRSILPETFFITMREGAFHYPAVTAQEYEASGNLPLNTAYLPFSRTVKKAN